jgi:hypothetical protein
LSHPNAAAQILLDGAHFAWANASYDLDKGETSVYFRYGGGHEEWIVNGRTVRDTQAAPSPSPSDFGWHIGDV